MCVRNTASSSLAINIASIPRSYSPDANNAPPAVHRKKPFVVSQPTHGHSLGSGRSERNKHGAVDNHTLVKYPSLVYFGDTVTVGDVFATEHVASLGGSVGKACETLQAARQVRSSETSG